mmetsp:Transcript_45134/g.89456  ORF Transcript_45134/g.89456 Transcript_45134/m.89456 type:complete len:137 (-) Transcript_45134:575-985(-)
MQFASLLLPRVEDQHVQGDQTQHLVRMKHLIAFCSSRVSHVVPTNSPLHPFFFHSMKLEGDDECRGAYYNDFRNRIPKDSCPDSVKRPGFIYDHWLQDFGCTKLEERFELGDVGILLKMRGCLDARFPSPAPKLTP